MFLLIVICIIGLPFSFADELPTCLPNDFHYEYTECDKYGGRWRVSVPPPNKCVGGAPNPPVRGKDCSFTCEAGTYLDMVSDQECHRCPAGTYSLGGGEMYDNWELSKGLPSEFNVESETLHSRHARNSYRYHGSHDKKKQSAKDSPPVNCSIEEGWAAQDGYLTGVAETNCASILTLTKTLVKPGRIKFRYQHSEKDTLFRFQVDNNNCQKSGHDSIRFPSHTKAGQWKTLEMDLKSGLNILRWRLVSISDNSNKDQSDVKPLLIEEISITGVAYTSQCSNCPPGYYSQEGSSTCHECPHNTFSKERSATCSPCDVASQYSHAGAFECQTKPACTVNDYYEVNTPCDQQRMTRKTYQWIKSSRCRQDVPESAQLPPPGPLTKCPPCNPGMQYIKSTNDSEDISCQFCPRNYYSDGAAPCKPCAVSTAPKYEINYVWFQQLPINVTTSCLALKDAGCSDEDEGWQAHGDYLRTVDTNTDDAFNMLGLDVGGFQENGYVSSRAPGAAGSAPSTKTKAVGRVEFVFETVCSGQCKLILMTETDEADEAVMQKHFTGTNEKQKYIHDFFSTEPISIYWAFQRVPWRSRHGKDNSTAAAVSAAATSTRAKRSDNNSGAAAAAGGKDYAKIYSIRVRHTKYGGAATCDSCPIGSQESGCIPCQTGHFISKDTSRCTPCPLNTVIDNTRRSIGVENCEACGEGLVTVNHETCFSMCKYDVFSQDDGSVVRYDFSRLMGAHSVAGMKLFTSSGTAYIHHFNISLCGSAQPRAQCSYNFTRTSTSSSTTTSSSSSSRHSRLSVVRSHICRVTIIPPRSQYESLEDTLATQPVSLGDTLVNVTHDNNGSSHVDASWKASGFESEFKKSDSQIHDIHFTYVAEEPTSNCKRGRQTILTLRCDPLEKDNGTIHRPPNCLDGTCDGCTFHFLWMTEHACPICDKEDYKVVKGECINGKQKVFRKPPSYCLLKSKGEIDEEVQACTSITVTPAVYVLIGGVFLAICLMLLMLLHMWKKNRKLEYKYHRLVSGGGGKAGELPGAESCGLEDEEEFDDAEEEYDDQDDDDDEEDHFDRMKFKQPSGVMAARGATAGAGVKSQGTAASNRKAAFKNIKFFKSKDDNPFETVNLTDSPTKEI